MSGPARSFRDHFLNFSELEAQLQTWTERSPAHCRLRSIGQTPEGRALPLLDIGPQDGERRPSVWVDGNMHAVERPADYFHPLADALSSKYYLNDLVHLVPEVVDVWARGEDVSQVPGLWVPGSDGEWRATAPRADA